MRRRLKEVLAFGTFLIITVVYFHGIFRTDIAQAVSKRNSENRVSNTSKALPGSWFDAVEKSLADVDKIWKSLVTTRNNTCIYECKKHDDFSYNRRFPYFENDFKLDKDIRLRKWLQNTSIVSLCDSKLKIYDRKFAYIRNVTLHAFKWDVVNFAKGGEELSGYKGKYLTNDSNEILTPKKGLLTLSCSGHEYLDELSSDEIPLLKYISFTKLNTEKDKLAQLDKRRTIVRPDYVSNFTLAIAREDYANLYHVTLHMFNIFWMLMAFKQQPSQLSVLILDAHPKAEIDDTLQLLFGPLIRIGHLKRPTYFTNLVLSLPENKSPLSKYDFVSLGYLEEFRAFMLNRHHIDVASTLNCQELHITMIWRRDKAYHPRNMKGNVERKIFNEAELFSAIYEMFPQFCVRGFLLETLPMKEQLKIIKHTDILIGMHGAALAHTLYLPRISGLIEMFPYKFKKMHAYSKMFEAIAKWRGVRYMFWENLDQAMEINNYFTVVDVANLLELVQNMVKALCG